MKKLTVLLLLSGLVFFSCKKKTKKDPEPETPVVVTPVVPDEFTVSVDDTIFNCKTCSSSFLTGGLRGVYFGDQNTEKQLFRFYFDSMPKAGTYQLNENSNPRMTYVRASTYYKVTLGVLNITEVDTAANGSIKKLTATFTAKTDTTYASYRIFKLTKGMISLDYK